MPRMYDLWPTIGNFLFGRMIRKYREFKIKTYKHKKVKATKADPEKLYHMCFKVSIKDKNGDQTCDTVFDISIPATGFFFAKKKLERYIVRNMDIEVIQFEALEEQEEKSQETTC